MSTAPRSAELAGPLHELEFPPMCANCGTATSESMDVAKVFRRVDRSRESSPDRFVISRTMVPFCPPCMAQHYSEVGQITPFQRFLMTFRGNFARSALGLGAIGLLVVFMGLRSPSGSLLFTGIAVLFGLVCWACIRAGYRETEYLAISPPTSITSAFDFTDDHSRFLERRHCTITLRNPTFAEAFLARNAHRIWNPDDPANRKAEKTRNVLLNVLIVAFLFWLVWIILKALR